MNAFNTRHYAGGWLSWPALAALLILLTGTAGAMEERFNVLQVGTLTYTNVTVTTKARNYIFILHAAGMASIKVVELSPELQQELGYASASLSKVNTNTAAIWAKQEMSKINMPQVEELGKQLAKKWRANPAAGLSAMGLVSPTLIIAVLGIVLLLYLFHCYCCMLICRKAGHPPGVLVWLPILQLFPLLRAAGMSAWWFLAYCVPLLNIVAQVLWSLKIAKARGKSVWIGILLLLPVANLFAFLYLAFSNGAAAEEDEEPEPKVMTLQTV